MAIHDLPATVVSDTIEYLMGHLATADKSLKEAEAECNRLRGEIAAIMEGGGLTSERTVWGLVTLSSRDKVTYSPDIKVMEIELKAAKSKELATGKATIEPGDNFVRVTWTK